MRVPVEARDCTVVPNDVDSGRGDHSRVHEHGKRWLNIERVPPSQADQRWVSRNPIVRRIGVSGIDSVASLVEVIEFARHAINLHSIVKTQKLKYNEASSGADVLVLRQAETAANK